MTRQQQKAYAIAKVVINELLDRGGFDEWWYGIDEDVKVELYLTVTQKIINEQLNQQRACWPQPIRTTGGTWCPSCGDGH